VDDSLEDLYKEALAASREKQWRRDNPYVADLIEALWQSSKEGISRRTVIRSMERARRAKSLPIPDSFEETVQSAFNQHCIQSAVFKKRNVPAGGLFSSRRAGNGTSWIVHHEPAAQWLATKNRAT
jgi:hypothetical protein